MATSPVCFKVDGEQVVHSLEAARELLGNADSELVLDFCSVRRIDSPVLKAMQELAGVAEARKIRIVLRNVSVDVYKVLKLVRLSSRLSFLN